jgi:magnesium-transporting ATPase (P-type)
VRGCTQRIASQTDRLFHHSTEVIYQASSPDEGALVKGAANLGYVFHVGATEPPHGRTHV